MVSPRKAKVNYINPATEIYAGLWILFAGAAVFVTLRIWTKCMRGNNLWYDDYVLVLSLLVLMVTDILITDEYATGYSTGYWDDRMHILINFSSIGTLFGQAWSKTALGITLLRMSNRPQMILLWFCIISMNSIMIIKVFFQWSKYCGKHSYQQWYRLQGPCINYEFEEHFKVVGNTYNIIMDFIFACFPWWITWDLRMRRIEKIALCGTMSLGMFVAIISAIRTAWDARPIMHTHDEWYMWRDAMSNIWFSAEVAGTIIVQCIPILRPFIRDIRTMTTSRKLDDTENETTRRSLFDPKRASMTNRGQDTAKNGTEVASIALQAIPEKPMDTETTLSSHSRSLSNPNKPLPKSPVVSNEPPWPFGSSNNWPDTQIRGTPQSDTWLDIEEEERKGLSPRPPTRSRPNQ
ncbi:hypothetical protein BP6252_14080 [Coleophoma cylindrospora]|uniref:Rhodopsin domain-containing protein n=1 Tax=Coleophoma cylindrospora TaxID=1849047 RepID=A0A3D8Q3Y2_9HELO|nr:hypothetical protein BP6252_14080 [Coleophoma cylindrospora]